MNDTSVSIASGPVSPAGFRQDNSLLQPSPAADLIAKQSPTTANPTLDLQAKPEVRADKPRQDAAALDQVDLFANALDDDELEEFIETVNEFLHTAQRALEFSFDQTSGRSIIIVKDLENDEVIRQIPPETFVQLVEHFRDEGDIDRTGLEERA